MTQVLSLDIEVGDDFDARGVEGVVRGALKGKNPLGVIMHSNTTEFDETGAMVE